MTVNKNTGTATTPEPKDGRPRRAQPAPAPARAEAAALVQVFDRLRDGLFRRLERIEALAVEQAELLEQGSSEREQVLRERLSALEAAQARLQAEVKRKEQEWQTTLQQLESDRRLLAEAWERLEQEQLDAPAVPDRQAPAPVPAAVERPPARRPSADDPSDEAVTRAILNQFQALKGDVRRNAKKGGGGY